MVFASDTGSNNPDRLELGKGFAFMARQQRITLDGEHYSIDLVFYNRLTRSFVLLDLKLGKTDAPGLGTDADVRQ